MNKLNENNLTKEDMEYWKEQPIQVLESLKILFNSDSGKDDYFRNVVLYQLGEWTLKDIYNYYIIEEENPNTKLDIVHKKSDNDHITSIKKGSFDF